MIRRASFMIVLVLMVLLGGSPLFAQQQNAEDDVPQMFVKTLYVDRVYEHDEGFRAVYLTSGMRPAQVFLPRGWFQSSAGKGEIIYGQDPKYPYMEIYWADSEFSFVRLFVMDDYGHSSWGVVTGRSDYSDEFNTDTLVVQF